MVFTCVSVLETDLKRAVAAARGLRCDIVEVRLDGLRYSADLRPLARIRQLVMVTCMPRYEGGGFAGTERERFMLLMSCLDFADYVSVELRMPRRLRDGLIAQAKARGVKVIVTYHDGKRTPSVRKMAETLAKEQAAGANIAKIAFKPRREIDALRVLEAWADAGLRIPVIAISMGRIGRITRVAGPMLGGYLVFAAPNSGKKADAGQFTIDETNRLKKILWR